jgi:hypothetical protein
MDIPRAEKSPDRVDAWVYAFSVLNLNAYGGSDFEILVFDIPDNVGTGYSMASNGYADIWNNEDY